MGLLDDLKKQAEAAKRSQAKSLFSSKDGHGS